MSGASTNWVLRKVLLNIYTHCCCCCFNLEECQQNFFILSFLCVEFWAEIESNPFWNRVVEWQNVEQVKCEYFLDALYHYETIYTEMQSKKVNQQQIESNAIQSKCITNREKDALHNIWDCHSDSHVRTSTSTDTWMLTITQNNSKKRLLSSTLPYHKIACRLFLPNSSICPPFEHLNPEYISIAHNHG